MLLTLVPLGVVVVEIKRFLFVMLSQKNTCLKDCVTLCVEGPHSKSSLITLSHVITRDLVVIYSVFNLSLDLMWFCVSRVVSLAEDIRSERESYCWYWLDKISYQIDKLAEAIDQISLGNRKLAITKNANSMLEERIKILEKKDDRKAV